MTSHPPTSSRARRLSHARLRQAQSRYPRSLFAPGDLPLVASPDPLGLMLEGLELDGSERVLELGATSVYSTALLSAMAREVVSVVGDPELAEQRERELTTLGCRNARSVHAEPSRGWPMRAPYQAIAVAAGLSSVPPELLDQLEMGGRLVAPVGDADAQLLVRFHKRPAAVDAETLGACHWEMLRGSGRVPSCFPWTHAGDGEASLPR